MFSKLLHKILINKRNILLILWGISLFFILSDSAFAVEQTATFNDTKRKIWEVLQFITAALAVFLALITYLTTMFLSPEWINGSLFWLNKVFKGIWILVSNLVYIIFAFILIWIAFMNIIWKWQDKYALKQALPKFIVGILIVPFSWFLVNIILSISSVLTVSALSLPFDNFSAYWAKVKTVNIPTACVFNINNLWKTNDSTQSTPVNLNKILDCWKNDTFKSVEYFMSSSKSWDSIFWVIGLYTYWVIDLESFDNLNKSYQDKVNNMVDLVIKLVFDFLFIIIYSVLMIALWLVLMTRGIYLWIYMMISPIFGLMYFFDKTDWWSWFFEKFNLKQFISLAFVPVFTMLALSFWLLFLFVIWNWMTIPPTWTNPVSNISIDKNTFKINEISLTISWSLSSDWWFTDFMKKMWNWALWVIWSLILKIFWLVVLWWAVMAALRTNDITKAVVEPLYQFGTKVWELATKAPQYAPIFGGQSMRSLDNIAWEANNFAWQLDRKRADNFINKHELFWKSANIELSTNSINALTRLKNTSSINDEKLWNDFTKALNTWKTSSELANNKNFVDLLKELLIKWWKKDESDKIKLWDSNSVAIWVKIADQIADKESRWFLNWNSSSNITGASDLDKYLAWNKSQPTEPQTTWNTNQTINLNIWWNTNSFNKENVSKSWITESEISNINKITWNISEMTEKQFEWALKWVWINDDARIKQIIEFLKKQPNVKFK